MERPKKNKEQKSPHRRYSPEIFEKMYQWDLKNHPAGIFDSIYLRRVSMIITRWLAPLPITPNHLSLTSVFLAFLAVIILYYQVPLGHLWAVILVQLVLILGYVDGDLARLKGLESKFGEWLDSMADMTKIIIIYFALAAGDFAINGNLTVFFFLSLLMGTRIIFFQVSYQMYGYLENLADILG